MEFKYPADLCTYMEHQLKGFYAKSEMDSTLRELIAILQSTSCKLRDHKGPSLHETLHDTEKLPDAKLHKLSSEALDLLSELRYLLEPGQLVLADHFMGA